MSDGEGRFTTVFRVCPVPMALTAEGGRIVEANEALGRLLGWASVDLVGQSLLALTHPDDRDVSVNGGRQVMDRALSTVTVDKSYVRRDGVVIPVRVTLLAFDDPDRQARKLTQVEDLTERRRAEAALARDADADPLTGLANRRALQRRLKSMLGAASHSPLSGRPTNGLGGSGAVLFVDLDGFKDINDAHGHAVGDLVLAAVGGRLRGGHRSGDLVARWGGDEFVIVLDRANQRQIQAAVQHVRDATHRANTRRRPYPAHQRDRRRRRVQPRGHQAGRPRRPRRPGHGELADGWCPFLRPLSGLTGRVHLLEKGVRGRAGRSLPQICSCMPPTLRAARRRARFLTDSNNGPQGWKPRNHRLRGRITQLVEEGDMHELTNTLDAARAMNRELIGELNRDERSPTTPTGQRPTRRRP